MVLHQTLNPKPSARACGHSSQPCETGKSLSIPRPRGPKQVCGFGFVAEGLGLRALWLSQAEEQVSRSPRALYTGPSKFWARGVGLDALQWAALGDDYSQS